MIDRAYISFLKALQHRGFKTAIIAGGAIRDDFFKEDFKDLDIFLWHPGCSDEIPLINGKKTGWTDIDEYTINRIIEDIGIDSIILGYDPNPTSRNKTGYVYDGGIVDVWNLYYGGKGKPIQLIFTEDNPVDYVNEHFDIGLCMCYCDGQKVRYSNNFMNDYMHKTITICGDLSRKEFEHSVEHHLDRVKAKFPGYSVKVAKELEKFLTPELKQLL